METVTITKAEYDALIANQAHLEQQVKYLLDQMRLARHKQFGAFSEKSEYDAAQLSLFNEAEVFGRPEAEPELVEIEKHYRKRTRLTTDKLPDDLPVEVVEHGLPDNELVPTAVVSCTSWARKPAGSWSSSRPRRKSGSMCATPIPAVTVSKQRLLCRW